MIIFVSQAAMLRHRRALHYRQRAPKDSDIDIDKIINDIDCTKIESIEKIV